jgi:hypothetical protein
MTSAPWRPGTDEIAFATASWRIEILNPFTGDRRELTTSRVLSTLAWPAWAPDGSRIACQANLYGYQGEDSRALLSAEAAEADGLTVEATGLSYPLAWCWGHDSRSLLYIPGPAGQGGPKGGPGAVLARSFLPGWKEATHVLKLSPDGCLLACVRSRAGTLWYDLIVVDQSLRTQVYSSDFEVAYPDVIWSPDSRTIVAASVGAAGEQGAVVAIQVRNGEVRRLPQPALRGARVEAWTSDGEGRDRLFYLDSSATRILETQGLFGQVRVAGSACGGGKLSVLPRAPTG